jgi:hypothetical protein
MCEGVSALSSPFWAKQVMIGRDNVRLLPLRDRRAAYCFEQSCSNLGYSAGDLLGHIFRPGQASRKEQG